MKPAQRDQLLTQAALLLALAVVFFPVLCVLVGALKGPDEILVFSRFFPEHPTLDNFRGILERTDEIPIFRWLFNSVFVAAANAGLVIVVAAMAAYPLARLPLPGKRP